MANGWLMGGKEKSFTFDLVWSGGLSGLLYNICFFSVVDGRCEREGEEGFGTIRKLLWFPLTWTSSPPHQQSSLRMECIEVAFRRRRRRRDVFVGFFGESAAPPTRAKWFSIWFLTYISHAATSNGLQIRSKQSHCFSLCRNDLWAAIVSEGSGSGLRADISWNCDF